MFKIIFRAIWTLISIVYMAYALITTEFFSTTSNIFESGGYLEFSLICSILAFPVVINFVKKRYNEAKRDEDPTYSIHSDGTIHKDSNLWVSVVLIIIVTAIGAPFMLIYTVFKNISIIFKDSAEIKSKKAKKQARTVVQSSPSARKEPSDPPKIKQPKPLGTTEDIFNKDFYGIVELTQEQKTVKMEILLRRKLGNGVYVLMNEVGRPIDEDTVSVYRINEENQSMYLLGDDDPIEFFVTEFVFYEYVYEADEV